MWYSGDMKKMPFLTVFLLSLLVVTSCNHNASEYIPVIDTASIKYVVRQAQNKVIWTEPIEPDALSAEPAGKSDVIFFPSAGFSGVMGGAAVYPELEDLGSLDVSSVKREILTGIHTFLKEIANKTLSFDSSYFDKPYEGVVILYEASLLPEIKSWTIGKPSESRGSLPSYEVPVQLVTAEGTCNIRIYLNPEKLAADEVCVQQVMFGMVQNEQ